MKRIQLEMTSALINVVAKYYNQTFYEPARHILFLCNMRISMIHPESDDSFMGCTDSVDIPPIMHSCSGPLDDFAINGQR